MTARVAAARSLSVSLRALGTRVRLTCADPAFLALATAHFGAMRAPRTGAAATLQYLVQPLNGRWRLVRNGRTCGAAGGPGELLLLLDQDLIVELQKIRPDLYFVHAAVLARAGAGVMLVAESGGGKSTTAWALAHHGFQYLSDELSPVGLAGLVVHPYPRALLLKRLPPAGYPLPEGMLVTWRGFHVTADRLPAGICGSPAPLRTIFFLRRRPAGEGLVRRLGAAEAAARLYASTLNALAHPAHGLDAAVRITSRTPCFELITHDLAAACARVSQITARERSRGTP